MGINQAGDADYFSALFTRSKVNALIHMDADGMIIRVNPAFTAFFGYENADVAGHHFSLLFTEEDKKSRKPWNEVKNTLLTGQGDDKNFMVHKNKQVSWVSGESILIEHSNGSKSLLKMIQDIHQQKDAEFSLNHVTDLNESILQVIDDFVVLLDSTLHIIQFNAPFARLFEHDNVLVGADFSSMASKFNQEGILLEKIKHVANTGIALGKEQISFATPQGLRIFEVSCRPIFTKDQASVLLLVGHDVTIHKKAETEREDLMGFVVHELRNPLTSIRMSNDVMARMLGENSGDLPLLLEKNKRNIERLTSMIAELYDAAKIGGGNFQLTKTKFDFDEIITEAVETCQTLYPQITLVAKGKVNQIVYADRYRVMQVLSNYINNAVKYSNDQPIVTITVGLKNQYIHVAVADNGVGISPSQMPYLFDRYFRAEKTRGLEGIGLGLYLCKRIITAHGGEVSATSEDGNGSVFSFTLPTQ